MRRRMLTSNERAVLLADNAWAKLLEYASNGLPDCYTDAKDMMYDWWPDLPWDPTGMEIAVTHLLKKPEAEFKLVEKKLKLDFVKECKDALKEINEMRP